LAANRLYGAGGIRGARAPASLKLRLTPGLFARIVNGHPGRAAAQTLAGVGRVHIGRPRNRARSVEPLDALDRRHLDTPINPLFFVISREPLMHMVPVARFGHQILRLRLGC